MKEVEIAGLKIKIYRKNIKHMYLRVRDGQIKVSAPKNLPYSEIVNFVEKNRSKIKIKKSDEYSLWGSKCEIKFTATKKSYFKNGIIYTQNEKSLIEFYRKEVYNELDKIYEKCIDIVGQKPAEVKVWKMKNWGNCNQKGVIKLNLFLAKKDKKCLEYVFIHELTHLIEFNHGKEFKRLMDKFMPEWRDVKKLLNS